MTLKQFGLCPTCSYDGRSFLGAPEFVSSGSLEFAKVVRAVVGQSVALEPSPKVFDWIQVGRIGRKKRHLDVALCAVEVFHVRLVSPKAIPDNEKRLF